MIYAKYDESIGYVIEFELTTKGKGRLAVSTEENIGKCIGIFIDHIPLAVADVVEEITDGHFYTHAFTTEVEMLETFDKITS